MLRLFIFALLLSPAVFADKISGYEFQSGDVQSLQDDDFSNPGMLWVDEGRTLFNQPVKNGKACRDCHADVKGIAARYPAYNERLSRLVSLTGQIQVCTETYQQAEPPAHESRAALALSAFLSYESRGVTVAPVKSHELSAALERGKSYYYTRRGQLNLSCAQCHEDNSGAYLRGDLISEGRSNGYPIYRLEWESLGSLHRRFRSCDIGVRAEPFVPGSETYTELELYLRERSKGLPVTAPAVRR